MPDHWDSQEPISESSARYFLPVCISHSEAGWPRLSDMSELNQKSTTPYLDTSSQLPALLNNATCANIGQHMACCSIVT